MDAHSTGSASTPSSSRPPVDLESSDRGARGRDRKEHKGREMIVNITTNTTAATENTSRRCSGSTVIIASTGSTQAGAAREWQGECTRLQRRTARDTRIHALKLGAAKPRAGELLLLLVLVLAHAPWTDGLTQDNLTPNTQGAAVVGDEGFICASFDGGYTWQEQQLETAYAKSVKLNDVAVLHDLSAIAVGGDCNNDYSALTCGIFRRPPGRPVKGDGMVIWRKMPLGLGQGRDGIGEMSFVTFCNSSLGFVVGEAGKIIRTSDAGFTWDVVASGVDVTLTSVHCATDLVILLAGHKGRILRSNDGGKTWQTPAVPPPSTGDVLSLLMQGPTYAVAVAENAVYISMDAGLTWLLAPRNLNISLLPPVQDVYLSFARSARYSTAILSTDYTELTPRSSHIQLLDFPLSSGRAHNITLATNTGIRWLKETAPISGNAVALPGLGDDCEGCATILVAGQASYAENQHCNAQNPTCQYENGLAISPAQRPTWCCGPLQMKAAVSDSKFSTAIYRNRSNVRVPVGCRDYTTCVTLCAISFTTGIASGTQLETRSTPPPVLVTGPQEVTLQYTVDVSSYDVFQLQIFVDKLMVLLLTPESEEANFYPVASASQTMEQGADDQVQVVREDFQDISIVIDYAKLEAYGENVTQVVQGATSLAQAAQDEGLANDLCQMGVRAFKVQAGVWGEALDLTLKCDRRSLPNSVAVGLVIGLACYVVSGILMAFLFSMPQQRESPKSLSTAYVLWFFFGLVGAHRFYLKNPKSGLVFMLTGGVFGLGWLADAFLTSQLLSSSGFDSTMETAGFSTDSLRRAPRPTYVTRRQALEMLSHEEGYQAEEYDDDDGDDDEHRPKVAVTDLMEDLELRGPDRNTEYISPVLYPHTSHQYSDAAIRNQMMAGAASQLGRGRHQVDDHREQINVVC